MFRREGELGPLRAFWQQSVSEGQSWGAVCTDGGRSADRAREAVRGLPGVVADYTVVDASSVRSRLLRSVPAFLRRPQVPPPNPRPCPPSLDLRKDECTLDRVTPSRASVVCPVT